MRLTTPTSPIPTSTVAAVPPALPEMNAPQPTPTSATAIEAP
jgi:hypothetical protein